MLEDFELSRVESFFRKVASERHALELDALDGLYERTPRRAHVTRYARVGHYFYMLADGNAVNFLHGASVGAFIFLVQAEILSALSLLASVSTLEGRSDVSHA